MMIQKFDNGSVLYTGDDLEKAFERMYNIRNNYDKSCDFCIHDEDSEECENCSIPNDLSCSCHINPPCSKCVDSRFEPTDCLINFKNYHQSGDGKSKWKWECFPTTEKVYEKFCAIEKSGFEMSAEILQTGEIAIYLGHVLSNDEIIEICKKVQFKITATKMIEEFIVPEQAEEEAGE